MPAIVFVPGILGSRLSLDGVEVWPPTVAEAVFGHDRTEALADPRTTAGQPIDRVACFDVYGDLLDDLAEIAAAPADRRPTRLVAIGYDWRTDLATSAERVAERLDDLGPDERDEIRLVGHSMGCLVLRLLLESGRWNERPWFPAIRHFVALAGPHRGTATALVRALGLEGSTGLSGAAIAALGRSPGHSALYALLPTPGVAALVDVSGDDTTPLDLWDPAVALPLGLDLTNLAAARAVHDTLARGRTPPHVARLDLAGSGGDGWLRVDSVDGRPVPRLGRRIGDGTVPLWSAIDPGRPHHAAPAPHEKVFRNAEIRALMHRALGAAPQARPFGAVEEPSLTILPARPVTPAGEPVELMLVPTRSSGPIDGELRIETVRALPVARPAPLVRLDVGPVGGADHRLIRWDPPGPGLYTADFVGSHAVAEADRGHFVVAAAGAAG